MPSDYFALTAVSPLDGRYRSQLVSTATIFSEFGLIYQRLHIEVAYLLFLSDKKIIPRITQKHRRQILAVVDNFDLKQAEIVKRIEQTTKHDVKAVEYYLTERLTQLKSPLASFTHICLTSEDVNSIAYALMLHSAQAKLVIPELKKILKQLAELSLTWANMPMLARTHGQPAVPTTLGKELLNFAMRLYSELTVLATCQIEAKLNGAVGNFNAQSVVFPNLNWVKLSAQFISSLGLQPQLFSTQIVPAESYSRLFSSLMRINLIFLDLNQDLWRYISDGYLVQHKSEGQVGSSTMPHKVNPIDFENSEANLGLANSLLQHFIQKLPVSRLQRDLSDSSVKRNFGVAIGYSLLAYTSLQKGLTKISTNREKMAADLDQHWEILSEAFQVILRVNGNIDGYQTLQKMAQGKQLTQTDVSSWITSLTLPVKIKNQLAELTPMNYVGLAPELVKQGTTIITRYLAKGFP